MGNRHFSFFESYHEAFKNLSPKIRGEIIYAMGEYYFNEKEVDLDNTAKMLFELIKPVMDKAKKRASNGRFGGAPNGNKNAQKSTENNPKQPKSTENNPKQPDKDKDKEKDMEKDMEKEKDIISPLLPFVDYEAIVNDYNNTCISYPKVTALSEARKKAIKARLKTVSIEDIHKAFEMAEQSDFLKGANSRNWSANFDWIMKDANLAKILDGNYTNKGKTQQDGFEWLSQQIREGAFHDEG